jgi:signal transduction histidine kinase
MDIEKVRSSSRRPERLASGSVASVDRSVVTNAAATLAWRPRADLRAPRGVSRRLARAGVTGAVTAVAAALVLSRALATSPESVVVRALVVVALAVVAGGFARRSVQMRRFGDVLIAVGLFSALALLSASPYSVPYSIGRVVTWLIPVLVVYLMLIFPRGALAPGGERTLFRAVAIFTAVLYAGSALLVTAYPSHSPWASCDAHCPPNAFRVVHHVPAALLSTVDHVRVAFAVALLAAVTAVLVQRVRSASPLRRRTLAPVVVAGGFLTVVLSAFLVIRAVSPDAAVLDRLGPLLELSVAAVPVAFLVGLVHRRLLIGDVLSRLSISLGGALDAGRLRAALASALGDQTLDLRLWSADRRGWVPVDGHARPLEGPARATLQIDDGGAPVALLAFDEALCADDDLLDAVATQTRATLRRVRVTAELEASLAELERSRRRLVTAAAQERARIERDLHDGAQQRLIALRIKLSIAEDLLPADPEEGARQLHELGPEIEVALDEMRALAHGIYPPVLADHGLEDALRNAVGASPLPVHLTASGITRHTPAVEIAVYFTCLEALQNAAKHARGATGVWVSLREADALVVEVRDDGAGFRPPPGGFGGGLGNMADRMAAVGGTVTIDSTPGRGTRVVASVASA